MYRTLIQTLLSALILALLAPGQAFTQEKSAPPAKEKTAAPDATKTDAAEPTNIDEIALKQSRLADKYSRLEELIFKMAEFEAPTNPRRAALLKQAYKQSKDRLTKTQLNSIAELLNQQQLKRALEGQDVGRKDMESLLKLLLTENRPDRLKSEQARIREYIRDLERLIRLQKSLQGQNEGGGDAERLANDQKNLAKRTDDLAKKIQDNEEGGSNQGDS